MDGLRFDAIARFLDTIQTRRGTLFSALAGVIGIALLADPEASEAISKRKRRRRRRRNKNRCQGGRTRCGGKCVDTKTDPRNCGRCLHDCDDDEVCSNGVCGDGCTGGLTLCNGVCVNTNTDSANCGRCGRACGAGQICAGGDCEQECPAGQTLCDETCVDTNTDPQNCGRCDHECENGEICFNGNCGCTVCDDDEGCQFTSVQAAIDAANAGDAITICKGRYTGDIVLDKNMTLIGAGTDKTTLEGTGSGSVVTIQAGVTAVLTDVNIVKGSGTSDGTVLNGGGILNLSDLTLTDAIVEQNTADLGAGVFNAAGAKLTLNNTLVQNNTTEESAGTFGGGIFNDFAGEVLLRDGSKVFKNEAGNAGGIHNKGVLVMSQGSQIAANLTTVGGAGGLLNDQGAVTIDAGHILINKAVGTGGGILILGGAVSVANNTEIGGNEGTQGGGVFIGSPGEFEATDSAITNNGATLGGGIFNAGATVSLKSTTVFENEATDTGGGIFNTGGGVVTLDNQSSVVNNEPNNCVGTNACGA